MNGDSDSALWQPAQYWKAAIADLQRKKLLPPSAWDSDGQTWPPAKVKRKSKPIQAR